MEGTDINCYIPTEIFSQGNFSAWLTKFEIVLTANGTLADSVRAKILPVFLAGQAYEVYHQLSDDVKSSFNESCKALLSKLGNDRYVALKELESCSLRPSETFCSLGFRIRKLIDDAYPDFPSSSRLKLSFYRFLEVIPHEYAKEIIADHHIVDFKGAIDKCNRLEASESTSSCQALSYFHKNAYYENRSDTMETEMESPNHQMEDIKLPLEEECDDFIANLNSQNSTCFSCRNTEHKSNKYQQSIGRWQDSETTKNEFLKESTTQENKSKVFSMKILKYPY